MYYNNTQVEKHKIKSSVTQDKVKATSATGGAYTEKAANVDSIKFELHKKYGSFGLDRRK